MGTNQYIPDSVSPPGETLLEVLEERNMPKHQMAKYMGISQSDVDNIIYGHLPIDSDMALQLELILEIPRSFWNNREYNYRCHEQIAKQFSKPRRK